VCFPKGDNSSFCDFHTAKDTSAELIKMFLFTGRLLIRAAALRRLPFAENRFTTFAGQL
jgi:hypothetical protein